MLRFGKLSKRFALSIFYLTLTDKFLKEYKFKEQIKRSSGFVMDNIAEGFGRESRLGVYKLLGHCKEFLILLYPSIIQGT